MIRPRARAFTPEVAALADAIHARYRALVLVAAHGGLRIGELAGLRRSRVDLLGGTVQMTEIAVEVHGVLHVGPPRTRASRLGWVASGRGKELLYDLPPVRDPRAVT